MLVSINGVIQEVTKLVIETKPLVVVTPDPDPPAPEPTRVEVLRSALSGPQLLDGPPKGFTLNGTIENWDSFPEGPLASLPSPWYPKFSHGSNSLNGANEGEIYVTPDVKSRGITFNPFSVKVIDGKKWLGITAKAGSASELPLMKHNGVQKTVLSGVMSSSLEQVYGYYEAEHICPMFKGSWFADWLMGPSWLPEIDAIEHLTTPYGATKWFSNIHWENGDADNHGSSGGDVSLPGRVDVPFKVGYLWHPNFIAVYFNGVKVFERKNPIASGLVKGLHQPAHRVINLAVGGPASTWATPVHHSQLPKTSYSRAIGQWKSPY